MSIKTILQTLNAVESNN